MEILAVNYSKGQMKIQEMAFMLVALAIFFSLVAIIYFSISGANLRITAQNLQEEEAKEMVRKLAGSSELAFTSSSDCNSCVDFDKALILKEIYLESYSGLWNFDYLMIEKISPDNSGEECTRFNYPDCGKITLIGKTENFGATSQAFVALARWDESTQRYKYEFGRIHVSGGKSGE